MMNEHRWMELLGFWARPHSGTDEQLRLTGFPLSFACFKKNGMNWRKIVVHFVTKATAKSVCFFRWHLIDSNQAEWKANGAHKEWFYVAPLCALKSANTQNYAYSMSLPMSLCGFLALVSACRACVRCHWIVCATRAIHRYSKCPTEEPMLR